MGTRHLTCVVLDNEYKVAQYGQWDGYPSVQGQTVVNFIATMNREKFIKELKDITFVDDDFVLEIWEGIKTNDPSKKFKLLYPEFHRDTGAGILQLIQDGKVNHLENSIDFAKDSLFCEWCYVVNLDENILEIYKGFNTIKNHPNSRFYGEKNGNYYPVRLEAIIPFKDCETELDLAEWLDREMNRE